MRFKVLFFLIFMTSTAFGMGESCQSFSKEVLEFQNASLKKSESLQQEKEFQSFYEALLSKQDLLVENTNRELQYKRNECFLHSCKSKEKRGVESAPLFQEQENTLYIFVSFSLGEKALLNLAKEAKVYNAILVLRGFVEGSYAKTAKALQKIIQQTGQGFLIDPELFPLFSIQAVPTFILSKPFRLNAQERVQTPLHDRLQGHVSISYILESFAKEGDLYEEAQLLLRKGQGT